MGLWELNLESISITNGLQNIWSEDHRFTPSVDDVDPFRPPALPQQWPRSLSSVTYKTPTTSSTQSSSPLTSYSHLSRFFLPLTTSPHSTFSQLVSTSCGVNWYRRGGGGIPEDQDAEGHRYDRGGRTRMGDAGHRLRLRSGMNSCKEEDDEEQDERDVVDWLGDTLSFPLRDPREGKDGGGWTLAILVLARTFMWSSG
ncbi:hypothetical protein NLI96_g8817 [Meripilus lineatus]|uniref:Uncharacterized protein n=1 Tax=Meripilus lineatus TaxID=2056292 RepID=A0AAD5YFY2_9APHY|nr:hypothetical protein NLI96_g8817 [Physisporinus lineatus]